MTVAANEYTMWVGALYTHALYAIDLFNDTIAATVDLNALVNDGNNYGAQFIAMNPEQTEIWVPCWTTDNPSPAGTKVLVYDIASGKITANITVGNAPISCTFTRDGAYCLVCNYLDATISVINAATKVVTATITLSGITNPIHCGVDPTNSYVFVGSSTSTNTTCNIYNVGTWTFNKTLALSDGLQVWTFTPDNLYAVVPAFNGSYLHFIELSTLTVYHSAGIEGGGYQLAVRQANDYGLIGYSALPNALFSVISMATQSQIGTPVALEASGYTAGAMITPDGSKCYFCNFADGTGGVSSIQVVNLTTLPTYSSSNIINTIVLPTGAGPVNAIIASPPAVPTQSNFLSFNLGQTGLTVTINTYSQASGSLVQTISTTETPAGKGIYVANTKLIAGSPVNVIFTDSTGAVRGQAVA